MTVSKKKRTSSFRDSYGNPLCDRCEMHLWRGLCPNCDNDEVIELQNRES